MKQLSKHTIMTVTEKVNLLKVYTQPCPLFPVDENMVNPSSYGHFFYSSSSSFSKLQEAVQNGDLNFVKKYQLFYIYRMNWLKYAFKLFNSYKGEKKLDKNTTLISINEGVLFFNEDFFTNYLKYDRLVKHAVVRCMKHPLNKG